MERTIRPVADNFTWTTEIADNNSSLNDTTVALPSLQPTGPEKVTLVVQLVSLFISLCGTLVNILVLTRDVSLRTRSWS